MENPKIAIFGGGIAGLTVAHECIEHGMEVDLYEKESMCGGKAVGYCFSPGLYTEHSVRVYSAAYISFFETLRRIPYQERTVFDNLVPLDGIELVFTQRKLAPAFLSLLMKSSKFKNLEVLVKIWREVGFSWKEIIFVFRLLLSYLCMCEERRKSVLETTSFENYVQFSKRSQGFQKFFFAWMSQVAAAKPYATAEVILELFTRNLLLNGRDFFHQNVASSYSVMNGPTSERLIDPWIAHLKKAGVRFHLSKGLNKLIFAGQKVESAHLDNGTFVHADAYILALPYKTLVQHVPELQLPEKINQEWSFGFQMALNQIPKSAKNARIFTGLFDSPWEITYEIEAPPIWSDVPLKQGVKAILSGIITCITARGIVYQKPYFELTLDQVKEELIAQLNIPKEFIIDIFSPPTVKYIQEEEYQQNQEIYKDWEKLAPNQHGYRWMNSCSLHVPVPEDTKKNIDSKTPFKNLFISGEFTKTHWGTPTMEKANQSGKVCAKMLCDHFNRAYPIKRLQFPEYPLAWVRKIDAFLFKGFSSRY